jgi:aminoglycoside 6'-N-acetyltransferase
MGHGPITFRPLRRDDFGRLATWLAEPRVARWWNHDHSPEAIERDFGTSVDGGDATEMFAVQLDGEPVGFIQRYPIAAYAEYVQELSRLCEVPPGALSIDYLIGDPAARGRGVGAAMIGAFVAESWVAHPAARDVLVPVAAGNRASWRALERAGFTRIAEGPLEPDNPIDPSDHVVYRLARPAA